MKKKNLWQEIIFLACLSPPMIMYLNLRKVQETPAFIALWGISIKPSRKLSLFCWFYHIEFANSCLFDDYANFYLFLELLHIFFSHSFFLFTCLIMAMIRTFFEYWKNWVWRDMRCEIKGGEFFHALLIVAKMFLYVKVRSKSFHEKQFIKKIFSKANPWLNSSCVHKK